MTERHVIHPPVIEQDEDGRWFEIRDETHEFVKSDTCDSEGLLGYTSMRCSLAYTGCYDRACVCRCHDEARTVESSAGGTKTSNEER